MNPLSPRHLVTHPPQTPPGLLRLVSSVVSALFLATLVLLSGCATTPADRAAKTLASVVQTVDVAMQGYATAVVLGAVPANDQTQIKKLYADYQAAVAVAETAITTASNSGDAGSLAAATAALNASRDQLLAFLARFTHSP